MLSGWAPASLPSRICTRSNGRPDGASRSDWITNVPESSSITCTVLRVANDEIAATIALAAASIQREKNAERSA